MSELISVCMPVYNRPQLAIEAVTSILNQSYSNLELIVVDDGSTDGTADVLESIEDPRLQIVRRDRNYGNISCRNLAFEKARGSHIALMDSDDVAFPHRLSMQLHALKRGFDLCGSSAIFAANHVDSWARWDVPVAENQLRRTALFGCPMPNTGIMMTRAFLERDPFRFDETYFPAADYNAWARALFDGLTRTCAVNGPLVLFRDHDSRISIEKLEAQNEAATRVRTDLLQKFGVDDDLIELHCRFVLSSRAVLLHEFAALRDLYFDILPKRYEAFAGREAHDYFTWKLRRDDKSVVAIPERVTGLDVSVIMPVYHVEDYLVEAIESVLRQSGPSFELILVDDGSTDGSSKIARSYDARHDHVRYTRQENMGLSEARNSGVALARSDYVLFVDSDDVLKANALRVMLDHARKHDCDIVVGSHDAVNFESGERSPRHHNATSTIYANDVFGHYVNLQFGYIASNRLIRNCLARRLRFFPGILFEDNLYCAELFLLAKRVGTLTDVTLDYRLRPGSITDEMTPRHIESWCTILQQAANLYWSTHLTPQERKSFGMLLRRFVRETHNRRSRLDEQNVSLDHALAVATAICAGAAYNATFMDVFQERRPVPVIEKVGMLRLAERKIRAFRKERLVRLATAVSKKIA